MNEYAALASFYDSLVADKQATLDWVHFIEKHASFSTIIEYACGSGEITLELAKRYSIQASDLSSEMVAMAQLKQGADKVEFSVHDMREYRPAKADLVLCLCDSLNYILVEQEVVKVLQNAYNNLNEHGTFIFDVHSIDRLSEFEDEFYEEGIIQGCGYEWSILTQDIYLHQNFVFFDEQAHPSYEQHIQRVYSSDWLISQCQAIGFEVEVYTDFNKLGISDGEKYFFVCRKGE